MLYWQTILFPIASSSLFIPIMHDDLLCITIVQLAEHYIVHNPMWRGAKKNHK